MITSALKREADEVMRELLRRIHSGELTGEEEDDFRFLFWQLYNELAVASAAVHRERVKREARRARRRVEKPA